MTFKEEFETAVVNYCKAEVKKEFFETLPANVYGALVRHLNKDLVGDALLEKAQKEGFNASKYFPIKGDQIFLKSIEYLGVEASSRTIIDLAKY